MASLLLLNGPNLNLLGTREPSVYGAGTLKDIETGLAAAAGKLGHRLESFQSNAEAELVDRVQESGQRLARPGRGRDQRVLTGGDERPAGGLGLGGTFGKALVEPAPHGGMKVREHLVGSGVRRGRRLLAIAGAASGRSVESLGHLR